jgi:hypothetical protein
MKTLPKSIYFVNPFVDFACMGGLSLFALIGFWWAHGSVLNHTAALVSVYLAVVVNWPHFSATNHRLFRRRSNLREYPLTAFAVPLVVLGGVLASFADPVAIAPFFLKIFLLWSPYHFSGQNVGLSLLYAKKAGFEFRSWERRGLAYFVFSTFLVTSLQGEVAGGASSYYQISLPVFNLPSEFASGGWYLLYGSAAVCVFALLRRVLNREDLPPLICLVPPLAQWSWFIVGWRVPSFYYFVPMFHSLQYLLVAWAMHLSERKRELEPTRGFAWKQTVQWVAINVVGGIALFWALPQLAVWRGIALPLATAVLIAAVQIHHFIVDGVIWRLRNPQVAGALVGSSAALVRRKKAA